MSFIISLILKSSSINYVMGSFYSHLQLFYDRRSCKTRLGLKRSFVAYKSQKQWFKKSKMSLGGGGGEGSENCQKKVSRIIWMAPYRVAPQFVSGHPAKAVPLAGVAPSWQQPYFVSSQVLMASHPSSNGPWRYHKTLFTNEVCVRQ